MDYGKLLGKTVRAMRMERKWTQSDLSRRTDLSISQISKIESGGHKTSTNETLLRLARGFGKTMSEFQVEVERRGRPAQPKTMEEEVEEAKSVFSRIVASLPARVNIYRSLDREGGEVVSTVYVPRKSPDDEEHIYGVRCSGKCLPMLIRKDYVALIDERDTNLVDGCVVLWDEAGEVQAGICHVLGDRRWAENTQGRHEPAKVYKVQDLLIHVADGVEL